MSFFKEKHRLPCLRSGTCWAGTLLACRDLAKRHHRCQRDRQRHTCLAPALACLLALQDNPEPMIWGTKSLQYFSMEQNHSAGKVRLLVWTCHIFLGSPFYPKKKSPQCQPFGNSRHELAHDGSINGYKWFMCLHEWLVFYGKLVGRYTIVPWILWVRGLFFVAMAAHKPLLRPAGHSMCWGFLRHVSPTHLRKHPGCLGYYIGDDTAQVW